jgi:hypothetical protein
LDRQGLIQPAASGVGFKPRNGAPKLDGLHEGDGCLLNPVSIIANTRNASIGSDDKKG